MHVFAQNLVLKIHSFEDTFSMFMLHEKNYRLEMHVLWPYRWGLLELEANLFSMLYLSQKDTRTTILKNTYFVMIQFY